MSSKYSVRYGSFDPEGDVQPLPFDQFSSIKDALPYAGWLHRKGETNIAISDDRGNKIDGQTLIDCIESGGGLTDDLKPLEA